uniref:Uncharacterized protein n=1 Tax=Oryza rufipogon TaxID=4529 RepID=A0A0E0Q7N5_ORYRU
MKSPASSHREQPWLSSVYGSPAAIGGSNRFEHKRENVENVLAHPVLTKQRNGGSEVQGAAETVVVGPRRQKFGVDVAGSTQGANYNFESTGLLGMSHRGCMREKSGGNSPEREDSPAAADGRKGGGGDVPAVQNEVHWLGVASVVRNGGRMAKEERGTHRGCTATTAKLPEPGKMAELLAFCAWGRVEWGSERERERWLVHSLCSLGIHWAWGTVDAVRGKWEAVMCVPGGKKPGLEILLVGGDVESKCAEVGWVRSLWFRFDGVMNMC